MMHVNLQDKKRREILGGGVALAAGLVMGSHAQAGAPNAGTVAGNTTAQSSASGATTKAAQVADILIIGGGSAGAVMARRLSEKSGRTVLLVEAGNSYAPDQYPDIIKDSNTLGANLDPEFEWGYKTVPGYVGHAIGAIRGKILGGSSAINGAVALRAKPEDYKRWNLPGWSYEDMLPHFKALEQHSGGETAIHGDAGPLPVHQLTRKDITPMQLAFMDATLQHKFKETSDFDANEGAAIGPYAMNVVDGVRINTGMSYLDDEVRKRANLTIRSNVLVDKVLFDGKTAIGIATASGEKLYAGQVILSAGTYGSAAILLRSGIGPSQHLQELDIPLVAEAPVGLNLVDHPFYYNAYAAKPDKIGSQTPAIGAKLWTHSTSAQNDELDLHVTATHLFDHSQSPTKVGFVLAVALVRPISRGYMKLASRDPHAAPVIDLNFLASPQDRERLLEGVKLARKIGATAPLADLIDQELNPGPQAQSDEAILASMKATIDTYHHPVASAPMGLPNDPTAVVDTEGRVYGVNQLRVVDASIFPDVPSVATNITTIAAAERIAKFFS